MTFEDLLRMQIEGNSPVTGEKCNHSPDFRVAVQEVKEHSVRIIVHADGHNSETLDFEVIGNELSAI